MPGRPQHGPQARPLLCPRPADISRARPARTRGRPYAYHGPARIRRKISISGLTLCEKAAMATTTATAPFELSQLTVEFNSTYELLLQQLVSKLRSLVDAR